MSAQRIKEDYFKKITVKAEEQLKEVTEDYSFVKRPSNLQDYPRCIRVLTSIVDAAKQVDMSYSPEIIADGFDKEINKAMLDYYQKRTAVDEKFENILADKVTQLKEDAKQQNKSLREGLSQSNEIYLRLEEKRKELEVYSEEVIDLCANYGITTSDIQIDKDTVDCESLLKMYDEYLVYMEKQNYSGNPITMLRSKMSDEMQSVALIAFIGLSFTLIWDIAAIPLFVYLLLTQRRVATDIKSYSLLLGLLFNIKPLELGYVEKISDAELLPEEIDEDTDSRLDNIAEDWVVAVEKCEAESPEEQLHKSKLDLANNFKQIESEFNALRKNFLERRNIFIKKVDDELNRVIKEFEDKKSNTTRLGEKVQDSAVFNTVFRLGVKDEILYEEFDIGLQNIVIHPTSTQQQVQFLQVLFANAVCNCKINNLSVIISDPNQFGQSLVSFYRQELEQLITFEKESLSSIIESLREFALKNMKDMRGLTINEYNTEAERVGKTPKDYRLLIILSQPKTVEEDEALREFMSYSANFGVFVWVVTNKSIENTRVFSKPFEGVTHPIEVDDSIGKMVAETLTNAIKNNKSSGLPWKEFVDVAIPDSEIWSGVTDRFVDLDPGFWDGDPTQYEGYTVGNEGDIHFLGVGGTGAGKSVFINNLIANATRKYSPRDLELWLIDYKGSEFSFYLPSLASPKVLPHIKVCLCTSDGNYAGSVYAALRKIAEDRYRRIIIAGFKNIKEYNQFIRQGLLYEECIDDELFIYNTQVLESTGKKVDMSGKRKLTLDDIIPRILFLNDEFQVIFEKAEGDIIDNIQKDITYISKVARAAGVHLGFFSQSMKGTVKEDTLQQFALRFALRCDKTVSQDIMGTPYASEIKQPFGYLYVRSGKDKSKEAQKMFRTPYLSDGVLRQHISDMAIRAEQGDYVKKDMISYDEKVKHDISELEVFLGKVKDRSNLFVLGERMTYSENKAPNNTRLLAENNAHIFAAFSDTADLVNFYKTMYLNIMRQPGNPSIITNTKVKDFYYLCELDNTVPEDLQFLATENIGVMAIYEFIDNIFKIRKMNNKKDEPVYVVLIGWDKAIGFGIDRDFNTASAYSTLLQVCAEYNIHFIFICSGAGAISDNIIKACNVGICGKTNEDTSYKIVGTKIASKGDASLKNGYMYIQKDGITTRAKIYQSKSDRKIESSELVL